MAGDAQVDARGLLPSTACRRYLLLGGDAEDSKRQFQRFFSLASLAAPWCRPLWVLHEQLAAAAAARPCVLPYSKGR